MWLPLSHSPCNVPGMRVNVVTINHSYCPCNFPEMRVGVVILSHCPCNFPGIRVGVVTVRPSNSPWNFLRMRVGVGTIWILSTGMGRSGPEVIKLLSCSTQLSIKFFLLINVKMPTNVGILTLMSVKNGTLGLSEPKKAEFLDIFILMSI